MKFKIKTFQIWKIQSVKNIIKINSINIIEVFIVLDVFDVLVSKNQNQKFIEIIETKDEKKKNVKIDIKIFYETQSLIIRFGSTQVQMI